MKEARSPLWMALFSLVRFCGSALGERPLFGAARGRAALFAGDIEIESAFLHACSEWVPDLVEEYGDPETVEEVLFDKDEPCIASVYEACFAELSVVRRAWAMGVLADDIARTSSSEALMRAIEESDDLPRPSDVASALREAAAFE